MLAFMDFLHALPDEPLISILNIITKRTHYLEKRSWRGSITTGRLQSNAGRRAVSASYVVFQSEVDRIEDDQGTLQARLLSAP